ncbi:MAG: hypothetical protein JXX29_06280 [Deltaproteobacteria bacterium]|nr:hypothetical protein [Deltaproteobacteria bacterium]MBN2671258.1 hypothetical protein [Deltaproteobacteria bacterium]
MHFEVLVEDQSGKKMLDILIPKIIGDDHTFSVKAYKGVGRIPKGLKTSQNATKRILLQQLPRLIQGYGRRQAGYGANYREVVFVVCDLDDKCLKAFRKELDALLTSCNPQPVARFCIAVEEGEAWLLGDLPAVERAYPNADSAVLGRYRNDSICGTWELLADAVYSGGSASLLQQEWFAAGKEKSRWAEAITPHMDVHANKSPSFNYFKNKLTECTNA